MANKTLHNKKALLQALEKSLGVVTTACKSVGISRVTFYDYCKNDPEFKAAVDELSDVALDFAESQLFQQIRAGNTASTIFYLKYKGKKRGYIERQEHEIAPSETLTFAFEKLFGGKDVPV
jgi:undecaprenyl pyrophosphate synthase